MINPGHYIFQKDTAVLISVIRHLLSSSQWWKLQPHIDASDPEGPGVKQKGTINTKNQANIWCWVIPPGYVSDRPLLTLHALCIPTIRSDRLSIVRSSQPVL